MVQQRRVERIRAPLDRRIGFFQSGERMIAEPRKAYVLLGAEPDLDFADPSATMAARLSAS